jgi:hypothetical protein
VFGFGEEDGNSKKQQQQQIPFGMTTKKAKSDASEGRRNDK